MKKDPLDFEIHNLSIKEEDDKLIEAHLCHDENGKPSIKPYSMVICSSHRGHPGDMELVVSKGYIKEFNEKQKQNNVNSIEHVIDSNFRIGLTQEFRKHLYSCYIGQRIEMTKSDNNYDVPNVGSIIPCSFDSLRLIFQEGKTFDGILILKSTSKMSDQEKTVLSRLSGFESNYLYYRMKKQSYIDEADKIIKDVLENKPVQPIIIQYLQSQGFAIPYMSVPVEKLVQSNWIKLKN